MTNRYRPIMPLGAGGMGELWLGVLEGAAGYKRPVVMKRAVTVRDIDADHTRAEEELIREAHVAAALQHPNVVHVYELIDPPEGLMLVMEFLDGFSLRYVLTHAEESGAPLPLGVAMRVVADGKPLEIVHRDVSPENLVVTAVGITKVVDFGIARSTLRKHTVEPVVKGKWPYLSPEQARGEKLEGRSDVFSLGAVLYETLTGVRLFQRKNPGETVHALIFEPAPELPAHIPAPVRDVVARMLVRDAPHRTVTAIEVADVLEAATVGRQGSHDDVRAFVETELGAPLARRRERIRELVDEKITIVIDDLTNPETETMLAIDIVLEGFEDTTITRILGGMGTND